MHGPVIFGQDLPLVVDRPCIDERDAHRRVDQIIEIRHLPVSVQESVSRTLRSDGIADDLPGIVDTVTRTILAAQRAQVLQLALATEKRMRASRGGARGACHLPGAVKGVTIAGHIPSQRA